MKFKKTFLIVAGLSLFASCAKDDDGSPQETKPVLNILDAEVTEGESSRTMTFTVELVGENNTNVVVSYSTLGGTAESALDFEGQAITELVFAAGETSKTINITIKGDGLVEPDETFEILLSMSMLVCGLLWCLLNFAASSPFLYLRHRSYHLL